MHCFANKVQIRRVPDGFLYEALKIKEIP